MLSPQSWPSPIWWGPAENRAALAVFSPWTRKGFQRILSTSVAVPWSLSENCLCSRLVSSPTAVHVLPSGNFHPLYSVEHQSQAAAPLRRRCQWQRGVLNSFTQPGLCSAAAQATSQPCLLFWTDTGLSCSSHPMRLKCSSEKQMEGEAQDKDPYRDSPLGKESVRLQSRLEFRPLVYWLCDIGQCHFSEPQLPPRWKGCTQNACCVGSFANIQ